MKRSFLTVAPLAAMALLAGTGLASCHQKVSNPIDLTVDTRGVTINMWTGFGASITAKLEAMLETFYNLTGIKVVHEGKGGYDNLQKAINGSASSQTYAHVAVGYPDHFAGYVDSDILHRLDDFIEQDKNIPETRPGTALDPEAEGETFNELPKFDLDDFYPSYMIENTSIEYKEDGTGYVLGIPFNKSTEVMVYNKTFFELPSVVSAGIALPTTWNEVAEQTQNIINYLKGRDLFGKAILASDDNVYAKEADLNKANEGRDEDDLIVPVLDLTLVAQDKFHPLSYDSQANFFITGMRQWGGTYTSIDKETRQGFIRFHEGDYAEEFLTEVNAIYADGGLGIPATWGEQSYCSGPFKAYKSVMNIGSSAGVSNSVGGTVKFEVSCAPIPYKNANRKAVISQGTNLGIFDVGTTAEKAAAWKLVKYLSQIDNGNFAAQTGYFPACKSAAASQAYQRFLNGRATNAEDKVNIAAAKVNAEAYDVNGWTKFVDPGFVGSSTIRTDVDTITGEVFLDNLPIRDVIDAHAQALKDYLPEE